MTARLVREGDNLRLEGGISYDNADALCTEGLRLLGQSGRQVTVDLSGLTGASSLSVAVLLRWARAAAGNGQFLRLAGVPERCRAIVRVSGLSDALPEA